MNKKLKQKKKVVYYAHPMPLYGTAQEQRDIELLEQLDFLVFNPAEDAFQARLRTLGTGRERQHYCERKASRCDVLAFRGLPNGHIPAGVAGEIEAYKTNKTLVIELPCGISRRSLDVGQTCEWYRDCGQR